MKKGYLVASDVTAIDKKHNSWFSRNVRLNGKAWLTYWRLDELKTPSQLQLQGHIKDAEEQVSTGSWCCRPSRSASSTRLAFSHTRLNNHSENQSPK